MTDEAFDEGSTRAVYNVLADEITDKQPEAAAKLPPTQLPDTNTGIRASKHVKFAPKRLIEQ